VGIILIDPGGSHVALISIVTADRSAPPAFVAQAMPIIQTFGCPTNP
jgi:hypothetical protein